MVVQEVLLQVHQVEQVEVVLVQIIVLLQQQVQSTLVVEVAVEV